MEFIHPSVSSKIIDNSVVFVTSQGLTQLFCALTSDTGPDNVITPISSPTEYIFNYGEPNMKKHGQAAYNVLNWLNSKGGAYILRVAPSNAGYAHAFVNIQTKVGTKNVLNNDGEIVTFSDVTVRPVAGYTSVNNISQAALEAELDKANRENSVDGFQNHWLFGVYPKGRGEKYNELGFKITLNDAYDETYAFRLYNFEVTRTNTNGSVQTIEGPFLVSLDPDAISNSNESMFITNVITKNSQYVNLIFNEDNYDAIGAIINPNVNPNVLDFFSGSTRIISNAAETYYDTTLEKDVDVHIRVQTYDENGVYLYDNNYIDPTNAIQVGIVDVDDTIRYNKYANNIGTVDNMKLSLSRFKSTAYSTMVDAVAEITVVDENPTLTSGSLKDALDAYESAYSAFSNSEPVYSATPNDSTLNDLETKITNVITKARLLTGEVHTSLDYARAILENANTLSCLSSVFGVESNFGVFDIMTLKKLSGINAVTTANSALALVVDGSNAVKITACNNVITACNSALSITKALAVSAEAEGDASITTANSAKTTVETAYLVAVNPYLLPDETDTAVQTLMTDVSDYVTKVQAAARLALLENHLSVVKTINTSISTLMTNTISALTDADNAVTAADTAEEKAALAAVIEGHISDAIVAKNAAKALTYNLVLKDFNQYVNFNAGTDGDLSTTNASLKATTTMNLLIQGYTGLIDENLSNKKEVVMDMLIDANYPNPVKNALVTLCTDIRDDIFGIIDTGFTANPQQALDFRQNSMQVSSFRVGIFTQDFIVYDPFTSQDIKVTSPFYLASKIPVIDEQFGLHWPFVGPRRGTISGFKKMSWNPTPTWKEQLYKKQVNYIQQDPKRVNFATQNTSQTIISALSNINNVRALLRIKREVENMAEDYIMEWNDGETLSSFQYSLDGYLVGWKSNRACTSISGKVYSSAYDKQQKIARVRIDITFNNVIERILIDLVVNK